MVVIGKFFFDDGSLLFYSFSEFEAECIFCLLSGMGFYFVVESDEFFAFVVTRYVDSGGRGTSWSLSSRTP